MTSCAAIGCDKPAVDGILCQDCLDLVMKKPCAVSQLVSTKALESQTLTVGRLFKALDEIERKNYAPKTLPPSAVVIVCWELKRVLTEQITKECRGEQAPEAEG